MRKRPRRRGFTLIELLMVVGIIALLMALLLPAIQGAREMARRAVCQSNLRQLYLGVQGEISARNRFPSGGWGWNWIGDPNRGDGPDQPGGWIYNILPFLDQQALHDMARGLSEEERRPVLKQMAEIAVPGMNCPTRRGNGPFQHAGVGLNNADTPVVQARSDYAINGGDFRTTPGGPSSYQTAETFNWSLDVRRATGLSYQRSSVRPSQIHDGLGQTYMIGEKYLMPEYYENGEGYADDFGICQGHDEDIVRWTSIYGDDESLLPPRRDTSRKNLWFTFGSAHPTVWNAIFCDGSVQAMSFELDPLVHRRLGNRMDGEEVRW